MLATTIHESNTTPHHQNLGQQHASQSSDWEVRACCLKAQQCAWQPPPRGRPPEGRRHEGEVFVACPCTRTRSTTETPSDGQRVHPTNRSAHRTPTRCGRGMSLVVLLRKEVIQPHLPVRLPCYDFVP